MKKFGLLILAALVLVMPFASLTSVNAAPSSFNNNGFTNTWNRVDKAVDEIPGVGRGYTWGPIDISSTIKTEPYNGGTRTVQYFDKARMEVNDPTGDVNSLYFVTTGLLVKELVTGNRQDGDNTFTPFPPSTVQIAGDPNFAGGNAVSPVYASFKDVITFEGAAPGVTPKNGVPAATGSIVNKRIDKNGNVTTFTPPEERRLLGYDTTLQHNIPEVFVEFGDQNGKIYQNGQFVDNAKVFFNNPTYVLGRPVTEAYWTKAVVAGQEKDVLVQLFERRVLTYTPSNPAGQKVEMGNVGQHYLRWRYVDNATPPPPPVATPTYNFSQARALYNKSGAVVAGGTGNSTAYPINNATGIYGSAALSADGKTAVVGTDGGGLVGLDITNFSNPSTKWTFRPAGVNFTGHVTIFDGIAYASGNNGTLYAVPVNSTGNVTTPKWGSTASGGALSYGAAVVGPDGKLVYFTADNGRVYAVDINTGNVVYKNPDSAPGGFVSGLVIADNKIYAGSQDGKLYAFGLDLAQVNSVSFAYPTLDGAVKSTPALANNILYVGTSKGTLYAFQLNGTKVADSGTTFTTNIALATTPAVVGTTVYVGTEDGKVVGVDTTTLRTVKWTTTIPGGVIHTSPAVLDGYIYFGANTKIYRGEINNAANVQELATVGTGFGSADPIVADGKLYLGAFDGKFYIVK